MSSRSHIQNGMQSTLYPSLKTRVRRINALRAPCLLVGYDLAARLPVICLWTPLQAHSAPAFPPATSSFVCLHLRISQLPERSSDARSKRRVGSSCAFVKLCASSGTSKAIVGPSVAMGCRRLRCHRSATARNAARSTAGRSTVDRSTADQLLMILLNQQSLTDSLPTLRTVPTIACFTLSLSRARALPLAHRCTTEALFGVTQLVQ